MTIAPLGDSAVLIQSGLSSEEAAPVIRGWINALDRNLPPGVIDVVPSFTTVAVFYDPTRLVRERAGDAYEQLAQWIETRLKGVAAAEASEAHEFVVPVCYGGEFGVDLTDVARQTKLSPEAVVRLHSAALYDVRAVGFSPGFPYLAGLPPELQVPRRATPRTKVPAGSVAIGGAHAGIYSMATPGGWNLLGRTPWLLFDPEARPPSLFSTGDRVRFEAIHPSAMARAGKGPLAARHVELTPETRP